MTENRFNLLAEKWIPLHGGEKISLLDAFSPGQTNLIGGTSIQKISIYKFLFAIGQAAVRLPDEIERKYMDTEEFGRKCRDYLIENRDCFWLYGEKPFLQYTELRTPRTVTEADTEKNTAEGEKGTGKKIPAVKKYSPLVSYIPDFPSDNESILREIQHCPVEDDAEMAVFLLGITSYALSGKRVTHPFAYHANKDDRSTSGRFSPAMGRTGYQHSFFLADDILTTIYLNHFTDDEIEGFKCIRNNIDPPWKKLPSFEAGEDRSRYSDTLWALYMPMTRAVLIEDGEMIYAEGVVYEEAINDPFLSTRISKKKKKEEDIKSEEEDKKKEEEDKKEKEEKDVLCVDTRRKPWRFFPVLMEEKRISSDKDGVYSCAAINTHINRAIDEMSRFTIWAGGLSVNFISGEQFIKQKSDFVESSMEYLSRNLGDDYRINYRSIVDAVSKYEKCLINSLNGYRKALGQNESVKDDSDRAVYNYWLRMDGMAHWFAHIASEKDGIRKAKGRIIHEVCSLYDMFCPNGTPRQLFAWQSNRPFSYRKEEGENKMDKEQKLDPRAGAYVRYVQDRCDDPRFRAVMKRADDEKTCMDSWVIIGKFVSDLTNRKERDAFALVGAAIARSSQRKFPHPAEDPSGEKNSPDDSASENEHGVSLGRAFYLAVPPEDRRDMKEFPARFSKIMRCMSSSELVKELRYLLPYFESNGISVNYARLLSDILEFQKGRYSILQVKAEWANDFTPKKDEEDENVSE